MRQPLTLTGYFPPLQSSEMLDALESQRHANSPQSWLGNRGTGAPPGKPRKHFGTTRPRCRQEQLNVLELEIITELGVLHLLLSV